MSEQALFKQLIGFASFVAVVCAPMFGQSRVDCNVMTSRILSQPVRYCVLVPAGYDTDQKQKYPVLYFLHGLGENEQALFNSGGWNVVDDLRQKHEIGDFLIATPEAKASFYVNSADGRVAYSDFFLHEFMPMIAAKYRVLNDRKHRAISGISMGGFGAFRFAFAYPDLFSAVSAESAALMTETPADLDAAMQSGGGLGRVMGPVFGNPVNVKLWEANNPFDLARKNKAGIAKLAIYFNCGREDDFGFENGAKAMDRQLTSEGVKHEFYLYPGNHNMDYFLAHLGEVIKFHSQHFGLTPIESAK